jgi:S1-C subfamily serine protease
MGERFAMKLLWTSLFLTAMSAYGQRAKPTWKETRDAQATSSQDTYVITAHTSVPTDRYSNLRDELYTIVHGAEILKVRYNESQTSSARPGDLPRIHWHFSYTNPDLSQIPAVGVAIRACLMSKDRTPDGGPIIAQQPTPAPCMVRIGNVLQYEPSPNSGDITYVYFDILSETTATPPTAIRAQSPLRKKDIPAIAKGVRGAVVSIIMSGKDGSPIAQGSGFLISKDGRILTNYHVIESGSSAIVKLPDGAFFAVDGLLAFDEARDVAIIKAHGEDFRTLTLGNSDQLQVGEEVVAIGNPLSLESTVSNGIISGIRTVEEEGGKFVQVTTPISPGSSGGPLFNMAGEVVGITTLYIKGGENLNFAIPINDAKRLLLSNSSEVQALPNEQIPTADPGPSLEATIDFMNRMVEPEKRNIALGGLIGTLANGRPHPVGIISNQAMMIALVAGVTEKHGYPEMLWNLFVDDKNKPYPRYMTFNLGDIDPSSIHSSYGGHDAVPLSQFWERHPNCAANPECSSMEGKFVDSGLHDFTSVSFKTADLKPTIEEGAVETQQACQDSEKIGTECAVKPIPDRTSASGMILFRDKERAERFVTAFAHAVNLCGGTPSMFLPTEPKEPQHN